MNEIQAEFRAREKLKAIIRAEGTANGERLKSSYLQQLIHEELRQQYFSETLLQREKARRISNVPSLQAHCITV